MEPGVGGEEDTMTTYRFGQYLVKASAVFFRSKLSYAFVNLKPIKPGHILIAPLRYVERFSGLTHDEVADMFQTAHSISQKLEDHYKATSLSIAVQDGPDAGQTVDHVHIHMLPRRPNDFAKNDDIYDALENHSHVHYDDSGQRRGRTDGEMAEEAATLRKLFQSQHTAGI